MDVTLIVKHKARQHRVELAAGQQESVGTVWTRAGLARRLAAHRSFVAAYFQSTFSPSRTTLMTISISAEVIRK